MFVKFRKIKTGKAAGWHKECYIDVKSAHGPIESEFYDVKGVLLAWADYTAFAVFVRLLLQNVTLPCFYFCYGRESNY